MQMWIDEEDGRRAFPALAMRAGGRDKAKLTRGDHAPGFLVWGRFTKVAVFHFARDVKAAAMRDELKGALEDVKGADDVAAMFAEDAGAGDEWVLTTRDNGEIELRHRRRQGGQEGSAAEPEATARVMERLARRAPAVGGAQARPDRKGGRAGPLKKANRQDAKKTRQQTFRVLGRHKLNCWRPSQLLFLASWRCSFSELPYRGCRSMGDGDAGLVSVSVTLAAPSSMAGPVRVEGVEDDEAEAFGEAVVLPAEAAQAGDRLDLDGAARRVHRQHDVVDVAAGGVGDVGALERPREPQHALTRRVISSVDVSPPPQPASSNKVSGSHRRAPRMVPFNPGHTFPPMPTVFLILLAAVADLRLSADLLGLRVRAHLGQRHRRRRHGRRRRQLRRAAAQAGHRRQAAPVRRHRQGLLDAAPLLARGARARRVRHPLRRARRAPPRHLGALRHAASRPTSWCRPSCASTSRSPRRRTRAPGSRSIVEVVHVNRSAEAISVPGCGEDRLLVDDEEIPMPPAGPCSPTPRNLSVRGAFVTRGRLPSLSPGHHLLRARWRDVQSGDVTVDVAP